MSVSEAASKGMRPPTVLTIAGSDSGGAAGLQADLKTLTALEVYGMSVITAVTAQNSRSVDAVKWLSQEMIAKQIDAVLSDYGADAVKTGFLGKVESITAVSAKLQQYKPSHVVIDPVLVNHKQESMFPEHVHQAYVGHLLPLADLCTPNLTEAAILTNQHSLQSIEQGQTAAKILHQHGAKRILIKGFADGKAMVDLFFDGEQFIEFRESRLDSANTHGSGDTLSSAICAFLAQGDSMKTAVAKAKRWTHQAIFKAIHCQLGAGHGPLAHF